MIFTKTIVKVNHHKLGTACTLYSPFNKKLQAIKKEQKTQSEKTKEALEAELDMAGNVGIIRPGIFKIHD